MKRYTDWERRLSFFVSSRINCQFEWGNHDCCMFACDGIQAITGIDPAHEFRGIYHDRNTAITALRELYGTGLEGVIEAITEEHGMPEIEPLTIQRGDIALIHDKKGFPLMGLCVDGKYIGVPGDTCGISLHTIDKTYRAWRVG